MGALPKIRNARELGPLAAKGEAKEIGDFPEFVTRQANSPSGLELQSKMPDRRGRGKARFAGPTKREKNFQFVAGLAGEASFGEGLLESIHGTLHGGAHFGKEQDVVRIAEIMESRDGIETPIERGEIKIGKKAGNGGAERDPADGDAVLAFVHKLETNPAFQQVEKVIIRWDQAAKLIQKKFMIDGRKIADDVALHHEKRRRSRREQMCNFPLATVETKSFDPVCVGVCGKEIVEAGGEHPVQQKINQALFPRVNVKGPVLAAKNAMERHPRAKGERFGTQGAVDGIEILRAAPGEIVEIPAIR